jgi:hypothetical protein
MYKDKLVHDFSEEAWLDFHQGYINDQDDFYSFKHEWIDNKVIYTFECKEICDKLNYDIFQEHDVWGKAESWQEAAFAALDDLLNEHEDIVNWSEMEDVLNEALENAEE